MKKVKIFLFNILILTMIFCLSSCLFSLLDKQKDTNNGNHKDDSSVTQTIPREFWGRWTRMDNGAEYYFDSSKIYVEGYELNRDISLFSLESDNVMKYGSYRLFRKDGQNRSFSFELVGFEDAVNNARISLGFQDIIGRRENEKNKSDSETIKPTPDGKLEFTDAVPGDDQKITITTPDNKDNQEIVVNPSFDNESMGTIPILNGKTFGFKTTYTINSDEQGLCYGNSYKVYNLKINFKNIGKNPCETSMYDISCSDPNLIFMSDYNTLHNNFRTILPNASESINLKVRYTKLDKEYIDVPIDICITDSGEQKKWNDKIYLRFYKGVVPLNINSRNFNSESDAELNGFIIYPDGRSKRFAVSNGYTKTVNIPWSSKDYILAFSGATAATEMGYSFGFPEKTTLASLEGQWSINEINAYENNDIVSNAKKINDYSKPIKAYLKQNDIDYYIVNNHDLGLTNDNKHIEVVNYDFRDLKSYSELNNEDHLINPGELINIDLALHNSSSDIDFQNVKVKLTSSSPYVNFVTGKQEFSYGTLSRNKYYSSISKNDYSPSYLEYSDNGPFQFTVSKEALNDSQIPLTAIITDINGESWETKFNLDIKKRNGTAEVYYYQFADASGFSTKNNGDKTINPGETIAMDIAIHNKGSSTLQGISSKLETTSRYISFVENMNTHKYGDLKANCYSTSVTTNQLATNYLTYSSSGPFKFEVSETTPSDAKIPFTLTTTDSLGNSWKSDFEIEVTKRNGTAEVYYYQFADVSNLSTKNNGDKTINPGETIAMDIAIHNKGSSSLQSISSKLETTSSYISFVDNMNTYQYGDLKANCYSTSNTKNQLATNYLTYSSSGPFKFEVSEKTPENTKIPFTLTTTDSLGNTWKSDFEIDVTKRNGTAEYCYLHCDDNKSLSSTNDDNNVINPGETISMDIAIYNKGSSKLQGITSKLETTSQYIKFVDNMDSYTYGDLDGNRYSTSKTKNQYTTSYLQYSTEGPFKFEVSLSTPADTTIPFTLTTTDSLGNTWSSELNINVKSRDRIIEIYKCNPMDLKPLSNLNNRNKLFNPGETFILDVAIYNKGNILLKDVTGVLKCSSPYITFIDNMTTCNYGDLEPNRYSSSVAKNVSVTSSLITSDTGPIKFVISKDAPIGTVIPFVFTITDSNGDSWDYPFDKPVVERNCDLKLYDFKFFDDQSLSSYNKPDGLAQVTETLALDFCYRNTGRDELRDLKCELVTDSPYIKFRDNINTFNLGDISAGNYKTGFKETYGNDNLVYRRTGAFKISISRDAPLQKLIKFNLIITDPLGNRWENEIGINIWSKSDTI